MRSSDPIGRLVGTLPAVLFQALPEHVDAAFAKALHVTNRHFEGPEWTAMLGQNRHSCCEQGFRDAAKQAGLEALSPPTSPVGGRYTLLCHQDVVLIRGNVQSHCGTPRASRFRQQWSRVNSWLVPHQFDLLEATKPPSADRLCAMLVVTADRARPSVPAFVGVGIPAPDLSHWLKLESISDIVARYHDLETRTHTKYVAPVRIKDQAQPRLKKKPGKG